MRVHELLTYSLRFYREPDDERLRELLELLDLDPTREIADLSHGNKKKLAIAQAMLHRPRLLILDEPTNGLDPLIQARFYDLLKRENKEGVTIFFSSHVLNEVERVCGRVAIIRAGRVAAVEEIGALRGKRISRVRVEFSGPPDLSRLDLPGVVEREVNGRQMHFLYSGSMPPLLQRLGEMEVDRLTVEEPTLEEIFMHYYGDQK
jgi:ABC-2 type transport system ATP-binding protein